MCTFLLEKHYYRWHGPKDVIREYYVKDELFGIIELKDYGIFNFLLRALFVLTSIIASCIFLPIYSVICFPKFIYKKIRYRGNTNSFLVCVVGGGESGALKKI